MPDTIYTTCQSGSSLDLFLEDGAKANGSSDGDKASCSVDSDYVDYVDSVDYVNPVNPVNPGSNTANSTNTLSPCNTATSQPAAPIPETTKDIEMASIQKDTDTIKQNCSSYAASLPDSAASTPTAPGECPSPKCPRITTTSTHTSTHTGTHTSLPAPQYATYKRRWIGLFGLALLNIIASWGWLSFSALSSLTAQWFGLSSQAPVNWLSTVVLFAYVAATPAVLYVLEKHSLKTALYACAALLVVGSWLRYAGTYTQKYGLVMAGQVLIGLAQPFALSTPTHFTNSWFTSRSRVSANAIASIANPLGGAVAQLVGPAMVAAPSDLKKFVLLTSCVATAGSLIVFVAPTTPRLPPCESAGVASLSLLDSLAFLARAPAFLLAFAMFSVYVGLFNAYSTFINQIMSPYGYSSDVAGYTGAILIVAGIVCAAISSPILDRCHHYLMLFTVALPVIAGCYVALIFTQTPDNQVVGPFLVSGVLGAISFSLLPALLEWIQEQTFPAMPALSSSLLWNGGQLFGAIFIISMNALKDGGSGSPPGNMRRALIFQAVWACVGVAPVFLLRRFSRENSRIRVDGGVVISV